MVHYFYGEDTYAARQALGEAAEQRGVTIYWLDRDDLEAQSLSERLGHGTRSLFGTQLYVVRDASHFSQALQEDIVTCVHQGLPGGCIVWDRGQPDTRSLIFRRLKSAGRRFAHSSVSQTVAWVVAEAKRQGGSVERSAAAVLVELVGCDKWRLGSELEKLLLSADIITKSLVEEAVPPHAEAELFSTLEALVRGDAGQALRSIEILLAEGYSEFYILVMLMYQFRTLLIIRAGLETGRRVHDIVREGKLKQFTVEKNVIHARRFSRQFLVNALTRILATEFSIKQGKVDARTGVLMLILSLVQQKIPV